MYRRSEETSLSILTRLTLTALIQDKPGMLHRNLPLTTSLLCTQHFIFINLPQHDLIQYSAIQQQYCINPLILGVKLMQMNLPSKAAPVLHTTFSYLPAPHLHHNEVMGKGQVFWNHLSQNYFLHIACN